MAEPNIDISSPEMEILYNENLLQEVQSDLHQEIIPETLRPHRGWPSLLIAGAGLLAFGIGWPRRQR